MTCHKIPSPSDDKCNLIFPDKLGILNRLIKAERKITQHCNNT